MVPNIYQTHDRHIDPWHTADADRLRFDALAEFDHAARTADRRRRMRRFMQSFHDWLHRMHRRCPPWFPRRIRRRSKCHPRCHRRRCYWCCSRCHGDCEADLDWLMPKRNCLRFCTLCDMICVTWLCLTRCDMNGQVCDMSIGAPIGPRFDPELETEHCFVTSI
jgi:hypothetical protein